METNEEIADGINGNNGPVKLEETDVNGVHLVSHCTRNSNHECLVKKKKKKTKEKQKKTERKQEQDALRNFGGRSPNESAGEFVEVAPSRRVEFCRLERKWVSVRKNERGRDRKGTVQDVVHATRYQSCLAATSVATPLIDPERFSSVSLSWLLRLTRETDAGRWRWWRWGRGRGGGGGKKRRICSLPRCQKRDAYLLIGTLCCV